MVPRLPSPPPRSPRSPHASGDGPHLVEQIAREAKFSPRERGWSPDSPYAERNQEVLPTRAGMVPERDGP